MADAAQFSQLLEAILSPDDAVRKAAETTFQQLKKENADQLCTLLLNVLQTEPSAEKRQQAAIGLRNMFRDLILNTESDAWEKLQYPTQNAIKTQIPLQMVNETDEKVRRAIADVLSDIGSALVGQDKWPELAQGIIQMFNHENVNVQIAALNVFSNLVSDVSKTVTTHLNDFVEVLKSKLEIDNTDLRIASVGLMVTIICNEPRSVWKVFENFATPIMTILMQIAAADAQNGDEESAALLQKLIEILEVAPEYFKPNLRLVLETMSTLARNSELPDSVRQLAVEFDLAFIDAKHKLATKVPGFLDGLVAILMEMMLDQEEDKEWMDHDLTADVDEETRNFEVGECGLDRLARDVGGDIAIPIVFARVGEFLKLPDWQHKTAGIIAISQTVEYLPEDDLESKLAAVVNLLLSQTQDDHYRVRFAACRALGQVALDHQPLVQQTFHEQVLPRLIERFDDPVARVQSQAFAAFVNFTEDVDLDDLLPYVPNVMNKVMIRLDLGFSTPHDAEQSPQSVAKQHRNIREQCITSVAVIAGVLSEQFLHYCATIVPLMKRVVTECTSKDDRQLRGRALECLSIIAFSVGVQHLTADVGMVMEALIHLFNTDLQMDDPVRDYTYEALRRMMKCLGKEATPFVPQLLPRLTATFNVQEETISANSNLNPDDYSLVCMDNGDLTGVKTSRLEEIESMLQLLVAILDGMKGAYFPFLEPTIQGVSPLLKLKYSDTIRRLALVAMGDLLGCARAANAPMATLRAWLLGTVEVVIAAVGDTEEFEFNGVDHLTGNVAGLAKCIEEAGSNVLEGAHIKAITDKVIELIGQSSERRAQLQKSTTDPELDEEDIENVDEEREREQVFRETLLRVLEAILKTHPMPFVESSWPAVQAFVKTMIEPSKPADDRSLAVFICCDVLQNLKADGIRLLGDVFQRIIVDTTDANAGVRQAACYACGLAMACTGVEPPVVEEIRQRLVAVIKDPASRQKANRDATENALSALLNIVIHQGAALGPNLQEHAHLVIRNLPLTSDAEEAQTVHAKLVDLLLQNNVVIWGPNQANGGLLMKILGHIYKTEFSNDDIDANITKLLTNIGIANVPRMISGVQLTNKEQRGLRKIEKDLTKVPVTPAGTSPSN